MPEYLAPGVFVEEIDSGSKPIEGVGTNTAAFIGYAKSGEFNKPIFISDWSSFCRIFGEEENAFLSMLSGELNEPPTSLLAEKIDSRKSWPEYAASRLSGPDKNLPALMKKYEVPTSSTPYLEKSYLALAVKGYFDNGGGRAYIVRVPRQEDIEIFTKALPEPVTEKAEPKAAKCEISGVIIRAIKAGEEGNKIKIKVESAEPDKYSAEITDSAGSIETYGKEKPLDASSLFGAFKKSKTVEVESKTITATKIDAGIFDFTGGLNAESLPAKATKPNWMKAVKSSGFLDNLEPDDFIGDVQKRTGMGGLAPYDDINMVLVPDLMYGIFERDTDNNGVIRAERMNLPDDKKSAILDAQCQLVAYCEKSGDRMAILDPLPNLTPQEVGYVSQATPWNCDHGQAALYYPWIKVADPHHRGSQMMCPPCGHIAGVWARVVTERGVHKAPANEALLGALDLEVKVTKGDQETLNPIGVNCIRAFPGTGIRVWGARTLATLSNQSWKYVNVRRLFNYLEKSIERGTQWVVFEPNDQDLWGRVRRNLSAFLFTEWKEGKLFGTTPSEAFYVKCDSETNPQEMIDLGRLYVEIGINPVKPAEFVIIRMGQWSGGGETYEQ